MIRIDPEYPRFQLVRIRSCSAKTRRMDTVTYEPGEYIIKQGEEGFDLFIMDSGKAFAQIKIGDELKEVPD